MLHNYLSIWLRTLARNRASALISLASLAVGLACAIYILTFLRDELSYERWIPGSEHIFRVEVTVSPPGSPPVVTPSAPFALAEAVKSEVPEATGATPIVSKRFTISVGDRRFLETVAFVDPQFFKLIHLPLIAGNPDQVLVKPESAVISKSLASKLFGERLPVNPTILLNGNQTLQITGVMRDLPYNTQLEGQLFAPTTSSALPLSQRARHDWLAFVRNVYVSLNTAADPRSVTKKVLGLFSKYLNPDMLSSMHLRADQLVAVRLTPFTDAHLTTTKYVGGVPSGTDLTTVYGFAAIAILVLASACLNYASVATAQSAARSREIAMRKIVGAPRSQLLMQFLGESLLLTSFAFICALILVQLFFPFFVRIIGHSTSISSWRLILSMGALTLLTGLLAGLYPALVLSNLAPAATLKSGAPPQVRGVGWRSFLVTSQFAISIGLAIATVVIFEQVRFAQQFDLGFRHDNIVIIDTAVHPGITDSTRDAYLQSVLKSPAILGATASATVPFETGDSRGSVKLPGNPNTYFARSMRVAADFPIVYGIHLLAGRLLSPAYGQDLTNFQGNVSSDGVHNVLISASAAREFGLSPAEVLGRALQTDNNTHVQVVGVVQDILLHGVDEAEIPTIFYYSSNNLPQLSIRIRGDQTPAALEAIDSTWYTILRSFAISRHFLNEDFERLFSAHEKEGAVFAVFSALTLVVACLGLFGLSAQAVQRNAKQIGLRRVVGASSASIISWQLTRFSVLVALACAVAWPVVGYALHHWLTGFPHRVALNPFVFLGVGLGALGVAWITVIGHVLYAARLNPVDFLRYE